MKNIVKLHATTSTSDVLKSRFRESVLSNGFTVYTSHQTNGRGQMGASWQSEPGKNLMFSMLYKNTHDLNAFQINQKTCVILAETIAAVSDLDVSIKWPNDILSAKKKIAGILVESTFKKGSLSHCFIGVGLNVNQRDFQDLKHASSIQKLSGKSFEMEQFLKMFRDSFLNDQRNSEQIDEAYDSKLYGLTKELVFTREDKKITATVMGTDQAGKLLLREKNTLKSYDLKELSWDYTSF